MKKYCSECGFCIEYTTSLPNFCPECGNKINPSAKRQEVPSQKMEASINDDFSELGKISMNFGFDGGIQKNSLGSILGGKEESIKIQRGIRAGRCEGKMDPRDLVKSMDEATEKELRKDFGE